MAEDEIDEEVMELIRKARQRRKGILPEPEPEQPEPEKKEEQEEPARTAGYRRRYLERLKRRQKREGARETAPEYSPPSVPETGQTEEKTSVPSEELVYSPPVLPAEIEEELKLPEKEETLDLMKQLEELEVPEKKACATCGAINSKKYYCPYCGKQFCTSCGKVLEKTEGRTVYECPNCHKRVVIEEERENQE